MKEQLDMEERETLERFERGELRRSPDAEDEIEAARRAARNTREKTNSKSHKSQFRQ